MRGIVGNENLRNLWDGLAQHKGQHEFLVFQDKQGSVQRFTYSQFNELIIKTANAFLALGVKKGENVAIGLYNSPEFISAMFALAEIGAVAVPLNMQYKLEECAYALDRCNITKVLTEPDFQEYYRGEGAYQVKDLYVTHVCGQALVDDVLDFDALVQQQHDHLDEVRPLHNQDVAEIIFTSGTTSYPKGVQLTHANLIFSGLYGNWEFAMNPDDRFLTTMPAFHSNFQLSALMPVLTVGATLVFIEKYSARAFWKQVRQYEATAVQAVAMMVRTMMLQPQSPDEKDHNVRVFQYYLAIADEEKEAFEDRFGVTLQNCYGSTESVCWVLTDLAYGPKNWPSVGRVGLGYHADIINDKGQSAAPGEVGEIVVYGTPGETLMKGYYDDPVATAKAMSADGCFFTGDKGYRDESGWFFFVDRKSNMIKRAGENISASEVEEVLMCHPAVDEAAVIGVPDPIRDQAVKAFVVFKEGAQATHDEILCHCAAKLADFKVPTILEITQELPHTSVGKIAKKLLS